MKVYTDKDAILDALKGLTVAVIGFGAQGRAQALCMRDSGVNVVMGLRLDGDSAKEAKKEGLTVLSISEAAQKADIVHILIPDEVQGEVYAKDIAPYMKKGKTLSFSHGFNISFKKITPPADIDVLMVAPKSPGTEERKRYLEGFGVPGLLAIYQNSSGKAKERGLAMAKACGFTRAGVIECTFQQEVFEDLFGEQAVLCGGLSELIKAGFETLTNAGYPPEMAYFECLHEMKLIVDLVYEGGMTYMHDVISNTAEYGSRTRGKLIITEQTRENMKQMLKDIESGKFADEWIAEYKAGCPNLNRMREEEKNHPMEVIGREIRALFKKK